MMMRLVLGLLVFGLVACEAEEQAVGVTDIVLRGPNAQEIPVTVELATTDESRMRGLMFRRELPKGTGMLFVWDKPKVVKMWMKNTYIPLDMVFFDGNTAVYVHENALPHDLTPVGPDVPVSKVLELPAGYAKKHDLSTGWQLFD